MYICMYVHVYGYTTKAVAYVSNLHYAKAAAEQQSKKIEFQTRYTETYPLIQVIASKQIS